MSSKLEEIFLGLGLDPDSEDMFAGESADGFVSNNGVSFANKRLSSIKTDYDVAQVMLYPLWLQLPFNPISLAKTKKGNFISSIQLGKTPAELINIMQQAMTVVEGDDDEIIAAKKEYAEKLAVLLNAGNILKPGEVFELQCNPADGSCSTRTFELFTNFLNTYNVQGMTQRYMISVDKTITRSAILKTFKNGSIDTSSSDPTLVDAFACETAFLQEEIAKIEAEAKANNTPTKETENLVSNARRNRIVTRPMVTSVMLCFFIPSNVSTIIEKDAITKYSSDTFNLTYAMAYDRTGEGLVEKLRGVMDREQFENLNFLPIQRHVPQNSSEVPNIGVAVQKTEYTAISKKNPLEEQIPGLYTRLTQALTDNEFLDEEAFKSNVAKFSPISQEEVLKCYANNISQYRRALSNPVLVNDNIKYLQSLGQEVNPAFIKASVIDASFTEVETPAKKKEKKEKIVEDKTNDADVVLDSEDEEELGSSAGVAKAEDFINAD